MSSDGEFRKLTDLRVIDLRAELEKRGLEKTGVKAALIERLSKALREENKDPDTYLFEDRAKRIPIATKDETDNQSNTNINEQVKKSEVLISNNKNNCGSKEDNLEGANQNETESATQHSNEESALSEAVDKIYDETKNADKNIKEVEVKIMDEDFTGKLCLEKEGDDDNDVVANEMDNINLATNLDDQDKNVDNKSTTNEEPQQCDTATTNMETTKTIIEEDSTVIKEKEADNGSGGEIKSQMETTSTSGIELTINNPTSIGAGDDTAVVTTSSTNISNTTTITTTAINATTEQVSSSNSTGSLQKRADKDVTRSLWISGLANKTRANDLKQLLSKFGKVVGAKIVANARSPSARYYGYVVMATVEDAENCIKHCHRSELHGRYISVDKARSDSDRNPSSLSSNDHSRSRSRYSVERRNRRRSSDCNSSRKESVKKDSEKKQKETNTKSEENNKKLVSDNKEKLEENEQKKETRNSRGTSVNSKISDKNNSEKINNRSSKSQKREGEERQSKPRSTAGSHRSHDRRDDKNIQKSGESSQISPRRRHSRERRRRSHSLLTIRDIRSSPEVLSFREVREEARRRQRKRQREREMRQMEERRRREEQERMRELERRNKKEATRLERERERLRIERERLQREKADLIRMERKRIEQERMELEKLKMEESRRPSKRPSDDRRDSYPDEHKRMIMSSAHRYDTSSESMHFDINSRNESIIKSKHEMYKTDDYKSRDMDSKTRGQIDNRDEYKNARMGREDMRSLLDDIRMRDSMKSRDDYKRDHRPDFVPPPPRLSGPSNVMSKYSSMPDSPPPSYSSSSVPGSGRDMMRRESMPSVMTSMRSSSGMNKDIRYSDRVGASVQSPEPPSNTYRNMHDDRRNDHSERTHMHRVYDLGSLKSGTGGGWHTGNNQPMKTFQTSVMNINVGSDPNSIRGNDSKPWMKNDGGAQMIWSSGSRVMDAGPNSGRYDRSNMERR